MKKNKLLIASYSLFLIFLSVYSYALVDLNFTLVNSAYWQNFRNWIIQLGYYNREASSYIYILFILGLFFFHYKFLTEKQSSSIKIAVIVTISLFFSYNFLSHDFFNYLFDAKILTYYKQNPYLTKPMDFPDDPWLRFMHWTHRTYPYGPVFLILTTVTSALSFGKFILSYLATKAMFFFFYLLTVFFLKKLSNKTAMFFATNPLVIIEGLINLHNDLIAVALSVIGVFYLIKSKHYLKSYAFFTLSVLIKYLNFPVLLLLKNQKLYAYLSFLSFHLLMIYIAIYKEIQPWYFLNYFALLPLVYRQINKMNILILSLLLSYYPYVRYSQWSNPENIVIKHNIILIGAAIYLAVAGIDYLKNTKLTAYFLKK